MKCILVSMLAVALGDSHGLGDSSCPKGDSSCPEEQLTLVQRQATALRRLSPTVDELNDADAGYQQTMSTAGAYADLGVGKCLVNGQDPKFAYYGGQGNACQQKCSDSSTCYGYSVSNHNNCLLWTQSGLSGGGSNWGNAHCYVKPTSSPTASPTTSSPCEPVEHSSVGGSFDGAWTNDWDGAMNFECPSGQVLAGAYSQHHNGAEDRRWKFECAGFKSKTGYLTPSLLSCSWSGETAWDATWRAPDRGSKYVITGVKSRHDNGREDRVYQFKSCAVGNIEGDGQRSGQSSWENSWDGVLNKVLLDADFFGDWISQHHNGAEDRQFAFDTTKFCSQAAPTPSPTPAPTALVYGNWNVKRMHATWNHLTRDDSVCGKSTDVLSIASVNSKWCKDNHGSDGQAIVDQHGTELSFAWFCSNQGTTTIVGTPTFVPEEGDGPCAHQHQVGDQGI